MTTRTICGPSCKCSKHTDTPRTDAVSDAKGMFQCSCGGDFKDLSRQLERELHDAEIRIQAEVSRIEMLNRELNASKSEVERLKKVLATSKRARASLNEALDKTLSDLAAEIANRNKCCRDGNQISDELFDTQQKLKKAEAEVEKLKGQLIRAVEIAEIGLEWVAGKPTDSYSELEQIKKSLNTTN